MRYYAIDATWIDKWLAYMQSDSRDKRIPPGPIDNSVVAKQLTAMKGKDSKEQREKPTYFNISKHLWLFFQSLHGGGPSIVNNEKYQRIELGQPVSHTEPEVDFDSMNVVVKYEQPPQLEDGIVGLHNNTYYCYMNACLQCLLPIDELRDYFIMQEYASFRNKKRIKNNFEYNNKFHEFFDIVFSKSSQSKRWVINPDIKKVLRRKFDPIMQHDSHEFMVFLFEQLSDESTPKGLKWTGTNPKQT